MKNKDAKGMALVFIAAVLWSTNPILVKSIELPSILIGAMRALIAGVVLMPFIRLKKIKWSLKLLFMMIAFTVQSTCIVIAIKLTSPSIAVGMQFTAPIWLYLYSRLKGYPFYKRRVIPLAVLSAGVVISMFSKAEGVTMLGNIIALSTGVWFAIVTQLGKELGGDNPVGMTSINNLFMALVLLPLFCRDSIPKLFDMDTVGWITLITLGVVQFGGGYVFYNLGLRYTSAAKAAMISPMEMVLSPVWVAVFMGEIPDIIGIIGFLVIVAGIGLEVLFTHRYEKAAEAARQELTS